ncbi:MAG: TlpA family protein disulfide reductase [Chloroflexi bacterium]|nr:TlpA family protein disulfide reductase [Chloroflexota bacterium]
MLEIGTLAPEVVGENLSTDDFSWAALRGKKSAVLVFATAAINPAEVMALRGMYERYRDQIEVITFLRSVPSTGMARIFIQQMGISWPVILDRGGQVYQQYGVLNPPAVYFVDSNARIAGVAVPEPGRAPSVADIENGIQAFLIKEEGGA